MLKGWGLAWQCPRLLNFLVLGGPVARVSCRSSTARYSSLCLIRSSGIWTPSTSMSPTFLRQAAASSSSGAAARPGGVSLLTTNMRPVHIWSSFTSQERHLTSSVAGCAVPPSAPPSSPQDTLSTASQLASEPKKPAAAAKKRRQSRKASTLDPVELVGIPEHRQSVTSKKPSKTGRSKSASLVSQLSAESHSGSLQASLLAPTVTGLSTPVPPAPPAPPARKRAASKPRAKSIKTSNTPGPAASPLPAQQPVAAAEPRVSRSFEDLLKDVPPPGHPAHTLRHWVVFSDLHVQEKSLNTCMQVVDRVLQEAKARGAGVLFLGDWWHERGSVAFKLLNACRSKLADFDREGIPMLMLVGNHDQVDIHGAQHGLTCLASPMVHVFTNETVFRDALWLPYRRHEDVLLQAKDLACEHYKAAEQKLAAIFAHADVATAKYNAQYQAFDGISPDQFPSDIPVYTGHYHMPHTVPNTNIQYIGSPYQVSASEVDQQKRLLVLDAEKQWAVTEEIPINYGVKHINLKSLKLSEADLQAVGPDSLVRLQVNREHLNSPEHERIKQELAARGATVQSVMDIVASGGPRLEVRQDSQPEELLQQYRKARERELGEAGLAVALQAIKDAAGMRTTSARGSGHAALVFESVSVEGFGPFVQHLEYPLAKRGLRVITGRNEDDAGGDSDPTLCSNGSGKSTLVSAALWALTGELTTRSESGVGRASGAVDSMLNDSCKEAQVRLKGQLDGKPFVVERAVKAGATSRLTFHLDGEDLTAQDKKATGELLSRAMCTSLLRYQAFVGQNDVSVLLEANDAESKQLLSQVVEMEIWDTALDLLKPQEKQVKKRQSELEGRVKARLEDVEQLRKALETAVEKHDAWQQKQDQELAALVKQQDQLSRSVTEAVAAVDQDVPSLTAAWQQALDYLHHLQQEYDTAAVQGAEAVPALQLPPAPTLEETRLALQKAREEALMAVRAADEQAPASIQASKELDPAELEARLEVLREGDRAVQVDEALKLQELQEKLAVAEREQTLADRAHEACKKDVQTVQQQLHKREVQLSSLEAGSTCEACGQVVDQAHVKKHIQELEVVFGQVKQELDAAKGLLKQRRQDREAARVQVEELQLVREEGSRTRNQEMQDVLQQLNDLIQRQRDEVKVQQEADKAEQAQLRQAHAKAEKQHNVRIAKLQADHELLVQAAQHAHQRRLAGVAKRRDAVSKGVSKVDGVWQQLLRFHSALPAGSVSHVLPPLPPAPSAAQDPYTASEADLNLEALAALAEQVERKVEGGMDDLDRLATVLGRLASAQASINPHTEEKRIYTQQLSLKEVEHQELSQQAVELHTELVALKEAVKALGREGIQSFVLERVLAQLQEESNLYLSRLSDTLRLELSATRVKGGAKARAADSASGGKKGRSKKSTLSPAPDGLPGSDDEAQAHEAKGAVEREQVTKLIWYQHPDGSAPRIRNPAQLSGGERRRVALALLLGFAKLLRDTGRLRCNLMVLDEGLQQLDADGCRRVFEVLRDEPYDTMLVVAQANSFATTQEHDGLDTVIKRKGVSQVDMQTE